MRLPALVYHLAEGSNWPSMQRNGLLCASRLIEAAGLTGAVRDRLERSQRSEHTGLPNGVHVRDQRPMPPAALAGCLIGMTPADWYATLNSRVFFWLDPDRLNRQRAACGARSQVVIEVDTESLIAAHAQRIAVAPINTGNARRKPALRGAATFVPLSEWLRSGWESEAAALGTPQRKRSHPPVEVTVLDAVPDIMRFVSRVSVLAPREPFMPEAAGIPQR